jgi:hypothetical protein
MSLIFVVFIFIRLIDLIDTFFSEVSIFLAAIVDLAKLLNRVSLGELDYYLINGAAIFEDVAMLLLERLLAIIFCTWESVWL